MALLQSAVQGLVGLQTHKAFFLFGKWASVPANPDKYIFRALTPGAGPERHLDENKNFVRQVNKYMGRIGKKLCIPVKITTYTARHTHATILKHLGAPIQFISDSLGHADTRTTEIYLDSFTDSVKRQFKDQLTNFNQEEE